MLKLILRRIWRTSLLLLIVLVAVQFWFLVHV